MNLLFLSYLYNVYGIIPNKSLTNFMDYQFDQDKFSII